MAEPKKYLTREGYALLSAEHRELMTRTRPEVVQRIADAAAEGDRSENAEYIYGKKRLRELDSRLRYLDGLIRDAIIVDRAKLRSETVCFGATVAVEDENGVQDKWTIVGDGEADARQHTVSWHSPIALALLGKRVGDTVTVKRPAGDLEMEILDLSFGDPLCI